MRLADFTSVIFSFGRWYGVLLSCTAANNFSIPNAPAMPAPARKKDLLFNEPIPCLLEGSHNFTKKGLPCPKEACNESSRSLTRPHGRYLSERRAQPAMHYQVSFATNCIWRAEFVCACHLPRSEEDTAALHAPCDLAYPFLSRKYLHTS